MIGRADEDVVDVEQKAASGPPDDLGEKLGFFDRRFGEGDVGRGIFEQDRPAERALRLIDMLTDPDQRLVVVRQGQEIVEERARHASTRRGARKPSRADSARPPRRGGRDGRDPAARASRWRVRPRAATADSRRRIAAEPPVRRTAGAHVVLGVDLEKAEPRSGVDDGVEMLGLETDADAGGDTARVECRHVTLSRVAHCRSLRDSTEGVLQGMGRVIRVHGQIKSAMGL